MNVRIGRVGRRESTEFAAVIRRIGKRDKTFVLTAVVPGKMFFGHTERKAIVQHAFGILVIARFVARKVRVEKRSGRQLLGVADYNRALAASKRTYRLCGGHLRRLVEYYYIEQAVFGAQILRNRYGTHKHTRRDEFHKFGDFLKEFP